MFWRSLSARRAGAGSFSFEDVFGVAFLMPALPLNVGPLSSQDAQAGFAPRRPPAVPGENPCPSTADTRMLRQTRGGASRMA
jgi:hypothetical protein